MRVEEVAQAVAEEIRAQCVGGLHELETADGEHVGADGPHVAGAMGQAGCNNLLGLSSRFSRSAPSTPPPSRARA